MAVISSVLNRGGEVGITGSPTIVSAEGLSQVACNIRGRLRHGDSCNAPYVPTKIPAGPPEARDFPEPSHNPIPMEEPNAIIVT